MTRDNQIQLGISPELLTGISTINPGQEYTLVDTSVIGPISRLRTIAAISENPKGTQLDISTIVAANTALDTSTIDQHFHANLQCAIESGVILTPGATEVSMQAYVIENADLDSETLIVSLPPETWIIRTTLNEELDHDTKEGLLTVTLNDHTVIINALLAAISGRVMTEDNDSEEIDQVVMRLGINTTGKQSTKELEPGKSKNPFKKFIGIDEAVKELEGFVMLADATDEERALYSLPRQQAILLHGPSGTGKTDLSKSIAEALRAEYRKPTFAEISGSSVSEWGKNLQSIFDAAISSDGRVLIHFDEADGLLTAGNEGTNSNINTVLKERLEELRNHPNVFVVFSTNSVEKLDPIAFNDKRVPLRVELTRPNREVLTDRIIEHMAQSTMTILDVPGIDLDNALHGSGDYDIEAIVRELDDRTTIGDIDEIFKELSKNHFLNEKHKGNNPPRPLLITQELAIAAIRAAKRKKIN